MNADAPKVGDFCNETILATERDCSLYDTIRWLDEYGAAQAIVVDAVNGQTAVVGVVERQALASAMMDRPDYDDLSLKDVMDDSPLVVREDDDLHMAVEGLCRAGREVAIVTNDSGDMVGLLALADVVHLGPAVGGSRMATAA